MHGFLFIVLVSLGSFSTEEPKNIPSVVRVNLGPADSLQRDQEPQAVEDSVLIEIAEPELLVESKPPAVPLSLEPESEIQLPLLVEPPIENPIEISLPAVVESGPVDPTEDQVQTNQIAIPSRMTLQQVIRSLSEQESTGSWNTDCNALQQLNELIKCDEEKKVAFSTRDASLANRYFIAAQAPDNTQQVQGFIGNNSGVLKDRLNTLTVDGVTGDYLISELEAGINVYSASGNVRLQRLADEINADDPAYQQMKRVMSLR